MTGNCCSDTFGSRLVIEMEAIRFASPPNKGMSVIFASQLPDRASPTCVGEVVLSPDDSSDIRRQKLARIVLDEMYQFLGLLDVDGNVVDINRVALEGAGICIEDIIGKPFWEAHWWAVSEDVRNRVKEMIARAANGEFVRCDIEVYGESHGHKTIIVDFSLTPIRDSEGRVAFLLPEGRNISEKVAVEAELTRKNGELQQTLEKVRLLDGFKTEFFANVSHELRTPLALILGPVDQLLKEGSQLSERERFRLATIKRNAQMLLQQVNDLLDLARIDADKMPMVYSRINVSTLVREVAANFDAAAGERSIVFHIEGPDEFYADVDRGKFERVVLNLLSNAFKFAPNGSRICCSINHLSENRFLLGIQDSGPGVPKEVRELIFGRFSQGQHRLSVSGSGSGLGLSIVKDFVELHGGTVAILEAPGGGAIFQVELPIHAPDGAFIREARSDIPADTNATFITEITNPHPSQMSPHPVVEGENKAKILIAEDNEDLRNFLCDVLMDDYHVIAVADGEAALARTLADPPDLVVSDLMMPHFDGQRFIRELRRHPHLANVPVLVLSARVDDALKEHLLADQVQDYLTKPFSPQELRVRIRNLVTVKRTVDILQRELGSQVSDVSELTANLVASRKALQDSLVAQKISERRWLGLYQNSAVGIALADRKGRVLAANTTLQKMLGYEEKELLGMSLIEITKESHRAMTQRNVAGLFDGAIKKYHLQKCYERKSGEPLWANVSVSLIPSREHEDSRLAVIVEDISSRKQAEGALAATQAELARVSRLTTMGELIASIAHEVNQPLSAIMTNSQAGLRWLMRESPDYHEVCEALKRVNRDASRAGEVITRIRNFLKIRATKREELKVDNLLEDLFLMLHDSLVDSGIRLERKVQPDLPMLLADPVQLQQVLLNLFINAIDAMRGQSGCERVLSVSVTADATKGAFIFLVQDTGPGISPEVAERIFDAFFSTKGEGLGMGLAISRSIVEAHGGRLWLAPDSKVGAAFLFNIPFDK